MVHHILLQDVYFKYFTVILRYKKVLNSCSGTYLGRFILIMLVTLGREYVTVQDETPVF